jgi:hypothetical protein
MMDRSFTGHKAALETIQKMTRTAEIFFVVAKACLPFD